jgi:protein-serine/threonine kinase
MDDDHGLGMSGLRRIRQQNPMRVPTLPSSSQAPSPKALPRSASVTVLMDRAMSVSPGPTSPTFTEDLSRFPSESLHSFSFAHADDMIHGRQKMLKLKRSMEYLRDPQMGLWTGASPPLNIDVPPRTSSPDPIDKTSGGPSAASTPLGIQMADGEVPTVITADSTGSENSSRTPTNESGVSGTTTQTSPPASRRPSILKRTMTDTDTATVSIQQRLMDVMGQRFLVEPSSSQEPPRGATQAVASTLAPASAATQTIHNPSSSRWVPTHQAIFTTQSKPPWTILAANDLACLMFGVTTAEVRKMGIMELVQEERREWLAKKLQKGSRDDDAPDLDEKTNLGERLLGARAGGVTGKLLSKPNSRAQKSSRRPATVHSGDPKLPKAGNAHRASKSRGVLLCGDVVPIQKRNGATGAATFWVIEKRTGLIWVLEEIHEDLAILDIDEEGIITKISGALGPIWGNEHLKPGLDIGTLIPRISRQGIDPRFGALDYREIARIKYYTCLTSEKVSIPATVEQVRGSPQLRVSSFPHIAGIIVVDPEKLTIKSSNSVFCGALFGHEKADGLHITRLVPNFDKILRILTEKEGINLVEGVVVPEHSFRKAAVLLALEQGNPDAAAGILGPQGFLPSIATGHRSRLISRCGSFRARSRSLHATRAPRLLPLPLPLPFLWRTAATAILRIASHPTARLQTRSPFHRRRRFTLSGLRTRAICILGSSSTPLHRLPPALLLLRFSRCRKKSLFAHQSSRKSRRRRSRPKPHRWRIRSRKLLLLRRRRWPLPPRRLPRLRPRISLRRSHLRCNSNHPSNK